VLNLIDAATRDERHVTTQATTPDDCLGKN
jgi:hypothetical protein